jgi:tRNA modification GTPase
MMYNQHNLADTIVALATPAGIGAIGVIRISGIKAISIADSIFFGKKLENVPSHTVHFGTIRDEKDKIIDEVLATVFVAPKSYTKENSVEISCHGSPYIQQQIIQLLIKNGARLAQAGEFTLRAFLNGQLDLSQAEAVADLIASDNEAAHSVALQQLRGGISTEISKLRHELIHFASLIELELDFAEEDVEFANRGELKTLIQHIQQLIKKLLDSFSLGNAIKTGVSTVIAGRPNAGKSTLLNVLLQEERAIVSEIAGTTRDTIEEVLNINGIAFRLIDTAGIREATDQIEAIGVAKTLEKVQQSAILIYVFDIVETKIDEVIADIYQLQRDDMKLLVICNKMDKNPYFRPEWLTNPNDETIPDFFLSTTFLSKIRIPKPEMSTPSVLNSISPISEDQIVALSAKEGMNIPYLKEKLFNLVAAGGVNFENTVVSNARHYEALQKSYTSLDAVLTGMDTQITSDFIAMDIRQALHYLGTITGEVSTDDLLDNIFSKFCIGK